jgi:hypothetical protein
MSVAPPAPSTSLKTYKTHEWELHQQELFGTLKLPYLTQSCCAWSIQALLPYRHRIARFQYLLMNVAFKVPVWKKNHKPKISPGRGCHFATGLATLNFIAMSQWKGQLASRHRTAVTQSLYYRDEVPRFATQGDRLMMNGICLAVSLVDRTSSGSPTYDDNQEVTN